MVAFDILPLSIMSPYDLFGDNFDSLQPHKSSLNPNNTLPLMPEKDVFKLHVKTKKKGIVVRPSAMLNLEDTCEGGRTVKNQKFK